MSVRDVALVGGGLLIGWSVVAVGSVAAFIAYDEWSDRRYRAHPNRPPDNRGCGGVS